jgi:hypothetical protein
VLIDDRAARYLASHQVGLSLADGRVVFVQPPASRLVRLMRRIVAAFRRRPVDAETIVG